MRVKTGVRVHGLRPEMVIVLLVAFQLFELQRGVDTVITSGIDGVHSWGSLHYNGLALDFRTKHIADAKAVARDMGDALGADYDVVLEGEGTPNEHIHVEFQPKKAY